MSGIDHWYISSSSGIVKRDFFIFFTFIIYFFFVKGPGLNKLDKKK